MWSRLHTGSFDRRQIDHHPVWNQTTCHTSTITGRQRNMATNACHPLDARKNHKKSCRWWQRCQTTINWFTCMTCMSGQNSLTHIGAKRDQTIHGICRAHITCLGDIQPPPYTSIGWWKTTLFHHTKTYSCWSQKILHERIIYQCRRVCPSLRIMNHHYFQRSLSIVVNTFF